MEGGRVTWGQKYLLDVAKTTRELVRWINMSGGSGFWWNRTADPTSRLRAPPPAPSIAQEKTKPEPLPQTRGWDSPWDVFVKKAAAEASAPPPSGTHEMFCEKPEPQGQQLPSALLPSPPPKPRASEAPGKITFKEGDAVQGFFWGEWHPAKVHAVLGDQIEVLWDSEYSVSLLPISSLAFAKPKAAPLPVKQPPPAKFGKEMRLSINIQRPPVPPPPASSLAGVPGVPATGPDILPKSSRPPPPPPPPPSSHQANFKSAPPPPHADHNTQLAKADSQKPLAPGKPAGASGASSCASNAGKIGNPLYTGSLAFFRAEKNCGIISSTGARAEYGTDVYAFRTVLERGNAGIGDTVCFSVHMNPKGTPQASSPLVRLAAASGFALVGVFRCYTDESRPDVDGGFIHCQELKKMFSEDVEVRRELASGLRAGCRVAFNANLTTDGKLEASQVMAVDANYMPEPGQLPASLNQDEKSNKLSKACLQPPCPPPAKPPMARVGMGGYARAFPNFKENADNLENHEELDNNDDDNWMQTIDMHMLKMKSNDLSALCDPLAF
eukprot:TRINITY_DN109795_c0_g1_i1.p1 TRINITY_DN109795_c0_g1~~TRINITY_DN109795_c0_g1_i1.p1  ORF type:complete len:642 (+),score=68.92 TRINITY_DN109795_c0_g1_i1:267-1928(+)